MPSFVTSQRGPLLSTGVVLVGGVIVVGFFSATYFGSIVVLALTYAIVTAGMAVQLGFSQQIVFSQSVFMGFGAYGVAVLNANVGIPSLVGTVIITLASGVVAFVIGKAVSRASGLALAVATLLFPLIGYSYLTNANWLGGSIGFPLTGNLWPGGSSEVANGLLTVFILAGAVYAATRLLASDVGLEMYVLGVSERTAAAMGVRTARRRLELFILGSMFAALGGAVYAGTQLFVPPTLVQTTSELSLLIMLFVGGRRSVLGAVIGAVAIQYFTGISNFVSIHILLIEGVLITVVLLIEPEGLAGIANRLWRWVLVRTARGRPAPAAVSAAPATEQPVVIDGDRTAPHRPASALSEHFAERRAAPASQTSALLECSGIEKEYGGLKVLKDVDLAIPDRGIFGLCGPNGAGKTTLLNVIAGSVAPSAGRVSLAGDDITKLLPSSRFRLGISRTFQAVHLIPDRTVIDNVAVACLHSQESSLARGIVANRLADARQEAMQALEYLGMGDIAGRVAGSLTLETQRMVELARALASRPTLLLLDEPASGLSAPQRERLKDVLRSVGDFTCVLLVEHDLSLVASVAERIFVLSGGALVFEGGAGEFRESELVSSLLVGV
ncbi:MAG TPA: ATP-binding cassette domain-containing protein [Solirubrobacteraceae bacterium]|jgi:branched-chain amino acid transport system permease protein